MKFLTGWVIQGDCLGLIVMTLFDMKLEKMFNRISFSFITFMFGQLTPLSISRQRNFSMLFFIETISALLWDQTFCLNARIDKLSIVNLPEMI